MTEPEKGWLRAEMERARTRRSRVPLNARPVLLWPRPTMPTHESQKQPFDDCPCPHEWQSLGKLYGISMGSGWVRLDTDPACPWHVDGAP